MVSPFSSLKSRNKVLNILLLILIVILTVSVYMLSLVTDNKYTISEDNNQVFYQDSKLTLLSTSSLERLTPVLYWSYYDGLLSPDECTKKEPKLLKIGEYSNFDVNDNSKNFGTYRTTIFSYTEDEEITVELYLPEISSAYKIFANGTLIQELGIVSENKNDYSAHIKNQSFTLTFNKSLDIVIQVSNFSHYYGGIYYPPLIASVETMQSYKTLSTVIYCFIFAIAILVSISALYVCFYRRDKIYLWSGLLSASFALYIFYPIYHMMGTVVPGVMYGIENISSGLISLFMLLACTNLMKKNIQVRVVNIILIVCGLVSSIGVTLFSFNSDLSSFFQVFAVIVKLFIALYLICMAFSNVIKEDRTMLIFVASLIYGLGIIFDVFVSSYYDPYYLLYPNELGTFLSVLIFLVLTIMYNIKTSSENQKWHDTLIKEVASRTDKMRKLMAERSDFVASVTHDLKSPISSLSLFVEKLRNGNLTYKEKEKIYEVMEDKLKSLTENLTMVQTFNNVDVVQENLQKVEMSEYLKKIYGIFLPETEAEGIHFKNKISSAEKVYAMIMPNKFERALDNILFNALSFTEEGGHISLEMKVNSKSITIEIQDDGIGMTNEVSSHVFDKFFSYREKGNSSAFNSDGLGLYYTKLIIEECGGEIYVDSKIDVGSNFIITIPRCVEK